jgi:hypothetical protein
MESPLRVTRQHAPSGGVVVVVVLVVVLVVLVVVVAQLISLHARPE